MRRRLPVAGLAPREQSFAPPAVRIPAKRAIAVCDTSLGEDALRFASALARALLAGGEPVELALLELGALSPNTALDNAALGVPSARYRVSVQGEFQPALALAADRTTVLVGAPAIALFEPALALLLDAERPLLEWPAWLRARRADFQLTLGRAPLGFADALAAELRERNFLPPR